MKTSMTRLSFVLAGILLSAPLVAQEKPGGVTIGYLNLVNAQLVTKALGLHEKEMGVSIKWLKFGSGGDMNRAVAADQVDFGGVGNPPAAIGITRDLPYSGILVLNMLGPVESLVVRSDKNIASLKDLVGKSVGVPFGSTTHYLMIVALAEAGVKPTEVKLLDLSPSDALAAWLRGDIDAAYVWEPSLGKMVANGGKILLDSGEMAKRGYPTWDIAVVMSGFASKYPDYVQKYVKSECAGIDFWLNKPRETAEIVAKELSLPIEDAARMVKGTTMVPCAQQTTSEFLGTTEKKGKFANTLLATATFLKSQNRLPEVKDSSVYENFLMPTYLSALARPR